MEAKAPELSVLAASDDRLAVHAEVNREGLWYVADHRLLTIDVPHHVSAAPVFDSNITAFRAEAIQPLERSARARQHRDFAVVTYPADPDAAVTFRVGAQLKPPVPDFMLGVGRLLSVGK